MRQEYFKIGDRILIDNSPYDPNLICKFIKEQYHQWIYTDVYGWVDVTTHNCHPVILDNTGWIDFDKSLRGIKNV